MVGEDARLAPLLGDDPVLILNPSSPVAIESLDMSTAEGYVFSQMAQATSLRDVAAVSPLQPEETLRLAYGLLLLDVVRHLKFEGFRFSIDNHDRLGLGFRFHLDSHDRFGFRYSLVNRDRLGLLLFLGNHGRF